MSEGKVGRPRSNSMKLQLALPQDIGNWVEEQTENQPFCRTRQDFIVGVLKQVMKKDFKETQPEQMELGV